MSEEKLKNFVPVRFSAPELKNILKKARNALEEAPLVNLPDVRRLSFEGPGVYAIYLDDTTGTVYEQSQITPDKPIYVGKAVPSGWRQARQPKNAEKSPLKKRLSEHCGSIDKAKNLDASKFSCKFLILDNDEADLIAAVESELIRNYVPLWNSYIDGFGNHDPGKGRYNQAWSEWDTLHEGRAWAYKLTGSKADIESIKQKIAGYK